MGSDYEGAAHQALSQGGASISLPRPCRGHGFVLLTLAFGDPESTIRSVLQEVQLMMINGATDVISDSY